MVLQQNKEEKRRPKEERVVEKMEVYGADEQSICSICHDQVALYRHTAAKQDRHNVLPELLQKRLPHLMRKNLDPPQKAHLRRHHLPDVPVTLVLALHVIPKTRLKSLPHLAQLPPRMLQLPQRHQPETLQMPILLENRTLQRLLLKLEARRTR